VDLFGTTALKPEILTALKLEILTAEYIIIFLSTGEIVPLIFTLIISMISFNRDPARNSEQMLDVRLVKCKV